jgi:hypothetical protein
MGEVQFQRSGAAPCAGWGWICFRSPVARS